MRSGKFLQFGKFLSVGLVNTLTGLAVIYLAKWYFHLGNVTANALGYAIGLVLSFILNSRWTFAYRGPNTSAIVKFLLVALFAYCMNLLTVLIAIHLIGLNDYIAQAMGIPPYTLTSYFMSKYFVFRVNSSPTKKYSE